MNTPTNWKNQRVGKLRVIEKHNSKSFKSGDVPWVAKCECGNEKIITSRVLRNAKRSGALLSCGCSRGSKKRKDWSETTIGRLTIKELIGVKTFPGGQTSPLWKGICECGGERELSSIDIRTAISQKTNLSCHGCPKSQSLDLIGQTIGSLLVGKPVGKHKFPSGTTVPKFLCKCDCGNSREINSTTLRQAMRDKFNLSCGCKNEELRTQHLGKTIGRLTVLRREKNSEFYDCECSCGNLTKKTAYDLGRAEQGGAIISCGCFFSAIKIGQRFGRLVVIKKLPAKKRDDGKGARGQWKCKCDCGNEQNVESTHLTLGKVKSCGCWYIESRGLINRILPFSFLIKKCPRCEKDLEKSFFGADKTRPGGLKSLCKKCNYECKDFAKVIVKSAIRKKKLSKQHQIGLI